MKIKTKHQLIKLIHEQKSSNYIKEQKFSEPYEKSYYYKLEQEINKELSKANKELSEARELLEEVLDIFGRQFGDGKMYSMNTIGGRLITNIKKWLIKNYAK